MSSFKTFQSSCKNVPACISRAIMIMFLLVSTHMFINAQATLSAQGILKKSNGNALEDGTYTMTFKIYAVDGSPSGVLWDETIADVELNGGIYSVTLGANMADPLTVPFDENYEMGVSVGTSEMLPRIRLTSAPYALSLIGQSNKFPSTGLVLADEIKVAQGVLASGGAPGLNGVDKNGYAFSGGSGDNDSGMFSTSDAIVSLFVNNTEVLSITPGTATVNGTLTTNNLDIISNGSVKYNGISDWRLVDVDDMETTTDGWRLYPTWNTGNLDIVPARVAAIGPFLGNILRVTTSNNQVFKKLFTIPGSWTHMKVKFKYYIIDSYGLGAGDMAYAGFCSTASGSDFRVAWNAFAGYIQHNGTFNNTPAVNATNFAGNPNSSDNWLNVEMTGRRNGISDDFWVFIGGALDMGPGDEEFGIGDIEIWVR